MNSTLTTLSPYIKEELYKLSYGQLAEMYKSKNSNDVLSSCYKKIYKLVIIINEKYWGLNEDDYESYCLELLDFCLKTFNTDSSSSFVSYFSTCYKNKLRELTESLNYKKRKCILEPLDSILDYGVFGDYDFLDELLPNTLTYKERMYCELVSKGYDNSYVQEVLNVSRMTICNIRKSLKIKLSSLQY